MFIQRQLGPVLGALLYLCVTPAFAGDWVATDSGSARFEAITYRSEKMLPGEEATLAFTGTKYDYEIVNGEDGYHDFNIIYLKTIFDAGEGNAFDGFEGISLRATRDGADLIDLFLLGNSFLNPVCGNYLLSDIDETSDRPKICAAACYQTLDDLRNDRGGADCASVPGRWFVGLVIGKLVNDERTISEFDNNRRIKEGRLTFAEEVRAATYLIVKVTNGDSRRISVPLDNAFRTAFWNPQP